MIKDFKIMKIVLLLITYVLTLLLLYSTYWVGFYIDADASLCAQEIAVLGNKGLESRACIHYNKRIVPFSFIQRYFRDNDNL